jgi:hypothetical protein
MIMDTIQVCVSSCLQEATEHVTNATSQPEDHGALSDLARGVPRAEHIVNTRIEAGSGVILVN